MTRTQVVRRGWYSQVSVRIWCSQCADLGISSWQVVTLAYDTNTPLAKPRPSSNVRTLQVLKQVPGVPKPYIRILGELEDYLSQSLANKEQKKKMSATNSKALNTMRQRLKKHNAQVGGVQGVRSQPLAGVISTV